LREAPEHWSVHRLAENGEEAHGSETAGHKGRATRTHARADSRSRCMATKGRDWLLPIPVPGNLDRMSVFGQRLRRLWWLTLRRRSQQPVKWDRVTRISARWIPAPRVRHPYPVIRFLAIQPRWEPYALKRSYGSGAAKLAAIPVGESPTDRRSRDCRSDIQQRERRLTR